MSQARRYHLQEAVGRGSFGTVYRATMETEGGFAKQVAVKILKPEVAAEPEMTRRLRDEARVLGLLRHRAILQVDGLVFIEGRWAVVMEFVEGINLAEAAGQARMPVGIALEVLAEIGSALHAAYKQPGPDGRPLHLIHRDIKPSNIRITPAGTVKVLDFGIARAEFATRESETASLLMGSFGYMSPERLDSIDGPEGDVYAAGVVLYEMVVGERLGRTSSNPARHASFRQAAVRRFTRIVGDEGAEAADLLDRLLAYDAEGRPEAREVEVTARRLSKVLPTEPLSEWAERIVPFLMNGRPEDAIEENQLSGMTLAEARMPTVEQTPYGSRPDHVAPDFDWENQTFPMDELGSGSHGTPALPPVIIAHDEEPPPWQRWAALALGGLVLASVGIALVLLRPDAGTNPGAENPEPVGTSANSGAADELPVEAPAPPEEPEERHHLEFDLDEIMAEMEAEKKPPAGKPTGKPTARPPASEEPAPDEPPKGQVKVTGDGVKLTLVGDKGRFSPGAVPAGTYSLQAAFNGKPAVTAGQLEVVAGASVTLNCNALFARCSVAP